MANLKSVIVCAFVWACSSSESPLAFLSPFCSIFIRSSAIVSALTGFDTNSLTLLFVPYSFTILFKTIFFALSISDSKPCFSVSLSISRPIESITSCKSDFFTSLINSANCDFIKSSVSFVFPNSVPYLFNNATVSCMVCW